MSTSKGKKLRVRGPEQPEPRQRPAVLLEEMKVLLCRHKGGDTLALSPKKIAGQRGGVWYTNKIKYLMKSALYYKPEIKGPFRQGENQKLKH